MRFAGSISLFIFGFLFLAPTPTFAAEFESRWSPAVDRVWAGPEFWTNPMEDWRVRNGRLECLVAGPDRNTHVLTRQLSAKPGGFEMRVRLQLAPKQGDANRPGWAGFRIAAKGKLDDYRDNVFKGTGINAGLTSDGKLFVGRFVNRAKKSDKAVPVEDVELRVTGIPGDDGPAGDGYKIRLSAYAVKPGDGADDGPLASVENRFPGKFDGNLALVSHFDAQRGTANRRDKPWASFSDWKISGDKVEAHDDHAFGPILFAQYTLSRGVMKLTAQLPPVGEKDAQTVRLQTRAGDAAEWKTVSEAPVHKLARTATFKIEKWNGKRDVPYRLVYGLARVGGELADHFYEGTVRKDPVAKETVVVAAFTGNTDAGFPNTPIVRNVGIQDPDLLVFTGDQLYEGVGGYGVIRKPVDLATLNYLRKWYMLGWSFGDLMRDRPTVCLPDDHDVYQGNIWGGGGRAVTLAKHASGGFVMDPEWVNMIQRTQTSHLPDPFDPAPVAQGIGVYYTDMVYGRVGFAIIEDRKFKSGPEDLVPPTGGRPDHISALDFKPESVDVPGAKLYGDRQLKFIDEFAADWRGQDMKASLTQTILANVANFHGREQMHLVADLDSNGWPQSARNKALEALRRGFIFMIAGDQHLPSVTQNGVDDWGDAAWSFCVPSIAAGYPRSWHPDMPGMNRRPGSPEYSGEFKDGLGNLVTVRATGNPEKTQRRTPLELLHDKASGYGIVRFHKPTQKITIECWRLLFDANNPKPGDQFPGWPVVIAQQDNYGRKAKAWLPTIEVTGIEDPVVQVVSEAGGGAGEIVYTLRIKGRKFRPKVFASGRYTIRISDPDAGKTKEYRGVEALGEKEKSTLEVRF